MSSSTSPLTPGRLSSWQRRWSSGIERGMPSLSHLGTLKLGRITELNLVWGTHFPCSEQPLQMLWLATQLLINTHCHENNYALGSSTPPAVSLRKLVLVRQVILCLIVCNFARLSCVIIFCLSSWIGFKIPRSSVFSPRNVRLKISSACYFGWNMVAFTFMVKVRVLCQYSNQGFQNTQLCSGARGINIPQLWTDFLVRGCSKISLLFVCF